MYLNRRALMISLAAVGLGAPRAAHARGQIVGGNAFGSTWRTMAGPETDMSAVRSVTCDIIADIDATMSPYRATSDLALFNASRRSDWQTLSASFCRVSQAACDIAKLTHGAFDPTVGPIVGRFGFGPITGGSGDYHDIAVNGEMIKKATQDLTLDLCGIAKGYALDRIVDEMLSLGVDAALVEVGGEARCIGQHPDGRDWQVAIADPFAVAFQAYRIVAPRGRALATSGHAANGVFGPMATSHIIAPPTARPASTALASVSVLAPTGLDADALATALCAVGPAAGIAMARDLDIAALFITDGSNAPPEVMTGGFPDHVLV
ncbi:MAG: FAD:protein FMN transferase [Yoonia sp.]|nr:FAD:protein FMN transferase [Yoonia sp.]